MSARVTADVSRPAHVTGFADLASRHWNATLASMPAAPLNPAPAAPLDRERDRPHPLQVEAWRAMGGSGRSRLGIQLRRSARQWKLSALRAQHPDWPDGRLRAELASIYVRGRT